MLRTKFRLLRVIQEVGGRHHTFVSEIDDTLTPEQRLTVGPPDSTLQIWIDKPEVYGMFVVGQCYYFDTTITPAE